MFDTKLYQIFNNIRTHFTIKNKITKNKVISLLLLDQLFFLRASLD